MSMIAPRIPFVIHWSTELPPDLSAFIDPIRIPFRLKTAADAWAHTSPGHSGADDRGTTE